MRQAHWQPHYKRESSLGRPFVSEESLANLGTRVARQVARRLTGGMTENVVKGVGRLIALPLRALPLMFVPPMALLVGYFGGSSTL